MQSNRIVERSHIPPLAAIAGYLLVFGGLLIALLGTGRSTLAHLQPPLNKDRPPGTEHTPTWPR